MLIIHGTVHTMDGPAIDNGFVAIREGKIWKVGPMEECPADWKGETLDARGGHILPGFVDAHCHLGMFGDAMGFEGDDTLVLTAASPDGTDGFPGNAELEVRYSLAGAGLMIQYTLTTDAPTVANITNTATLT